jgi:hypothetical protein
MILATPNLQEVYCLILKPSLIPPYQLQKIHIKFMPFSVFVNQSGPIFNITRKTTHFLVRIANYYNILGMKPKIIMFFSDFN